jgi:hypothetical protein
MAEKYPFPIPESTQKCLTEQGITPQALGERLFPSGRPGEPRGVGVLESVVLQSSINKPGKPKSSQNADTNGGLK